MESLDNFSFDKEKGEWKNKALGYRFMIIGEPAWKAMLSHLTNTFGSAAGSILYQSGLSIGDQMGDLISSAPDPLMGVNRIFEGIEQAGWGKFMLDEIDLDGILTKKPVRIREENGFFSVLNKKENLEYIGPFIRGVLCGIFDNIRQVSHNCVVEQIGEAPLIMLYTLSPE